MIEAGAVVRDSIIMKDAVIGAGCVIDKAIIAEGARIGEHVIMGIGSDAPNKFRPDIYNSELVIVGENSIIPDGVQIGKNTAISGLTTREDYVDNILESGGTLIKAGDRS